MNNKNKKFTGFSLIEILLVVGLSMVLLTLGIQKLVSDQRREVAESVGGLLKQLGEATNSFIVANYREIVGITSASTPGLNCGDTPGNTPTGSDPSRTCTLTVQALIDSGFLPASFSTTTPFDPSNPWQIRLRMANLVPPFNVDGLIISRDPWTKDGVQTGNEAQNNVSFEQIGVAIQKAGSEAGAVNMTVGPNIGGKVFEAFGGTFSMTTASTIPGIANIPEITTQGQIGIRVGASTSSMHAYARRDGSAPFTGNLDLGGNDVVNANNVVATGGISAGGNINTSSDVNAAGDMTASNIYAADSVYVINSVTAQQVNAVVAMNTPALNIQGGSLSIGMANDSLTGGSSTFGTATPAPGALSFGQFFDRSTGSSSNAPKIPIKVENTTCDISTTSIPSVDIGVTTDGFPLICQGPPGNRRYQKIRNVQRFSDVGGACVAGETALSPFNQLLTCNADLRFGLNTARLSSDKASCTSGEIGYSSQTGNLMMCVGNQFQESRLKTVALNQTCIPGEMGQDADGVIYTCKSGLFKKYVTPIESSQFSFATRSLGGETFPIGDFQHCSLTSYTESGSSSACILSRTGNNWSAFLKGTDGSNTTGCNVLCFNQGEAGDVPPPVVSPPPVTPPTPEFQEGGTYVVLDGNLSCRKPNPRTRNCSCPVGFFPIYVMNLRDHGFSSGDGLTFVTYYYCQSKF
jgi:type II secretory pathway pseudopilin PulG